MHHQKAPPLTLKSSYIVPHPGKISQLNDLAAEHNAQAIIHTGDFGFYGGAMAMAVGRGSVYR